MIRPLALCLGALGCTQQLYVGPAPLALQSDASALDAPADAPLREAPDAPDDLAAEIPATAADVASETAADAPVASSLCGNRRIDPGEDCDSCPLDLAARVELPNDEDDNCNGIVDEGTRVRLGRLHCANGLGCANPAGDWDHCFSTAPEGRTCSFAPGSRFTADDCQYDRTDLYVYPPTLGTTPEVRLRSGTLFRLWDCFSAASTRHVYVPGDGMRDMHEGWGYQCAPVGYVPLRAWPHGTSRRVYAHLIESVTDVYYDFSAPPTVVEGGRCTVREANPFWWAWAD